MKKKPKIQGKCPSCGKEEVAFRDHAHYINGYLSHVHKDVPTCSECWNDEIKIRKINNRRYKILEKY